MATQQELYSIKEAATITGTSSDFIARKIAAGELPAFYIGTGNRAIKRIRRDDLSNMFTPVPTAGHNHMTVALPGAAA